MGLFKKLFNKSYLTVSIKYPGIYTARRIGRIDNPNSPTGKTTEIERVQVSNQTSRIPLVIGLTFGMTVTVDSRKDIGTIQLRGIYRFPPPGIVNPKTGVSSLTVEAIETCQVGEDWTMTYSFDEIYELLQGVWQFELWDEENKLADKTFLAVPPWETDSRFPWQSIAARGYRVGDVALAMERAPMRMRDLSMELISNTISPFTFINHNPCKIFWGFESDGIFWDHGNIFRRLMYLLHEITEIFQEMKSDSRPWMRRGFGSLGTWSAIFDPIPSEELLNDLFLGTREILIAALSLPGFAFKYPTNELFEQALSTKLNIPAELFFCISSISSDWNKLIGNLANDENRWISSLKKNLLSSVDTFLSRFPIFSHSDGKYPSDLIQAVKVCFSRLAAFIIVKTQNTTNPEYQLEISEVNSLWPDLIDLASFKPEEVQKAMLDGKAASIIVVSPQESAIQIIAMQLRELDVLNVMDLPLTSSSSARLTETITKVESAVSAEKIAKSIIDITEALEDLEEKTYKSTLFQFFHSKCPKHLHDASIFIYKDSLTHKYDGDQLISRGDSLIVIRNSDNAFSLYRDQRTSIQEDRWI
jgi:hypothetical protein